MKIKLTKALLVKSLRDKMESQDFHYFKDTISGAQGLFAKKVNEDLYLTVGLTIHRYYDDAFTADLYLSKSTTIYCTWGDIPKKCQRRPTELLTIEESQQFGHGGWWSCEKSIEDFFQAIKISEMRMCQDNELTKSICQSNEIKSLYTIASKIKENIQAIVEIPYSFIPNRIIDDIPIDWFKATEYTLKQMREEVSFNVIKFHASDAFRQCVLDKEWYTNNLRTGKKS